MKLRITIDIKTRVFDKEDTAYRLFPGRGYRHYKTMRDKSIVFLDNPGLSFPGKNGFPKDDHTLKEIARSERKQPLIFSAGEDLAKELEEVDKADLDSARWSARRDLNRGWLNALYHTAKIGDLIVVPSPSIVKNDQGQWEKAHSLVGEIIGEPERWERDGPQNLLLAKYIVRRVRWLTQLEESDLDPKTILALRTQNALTRLPATSLERSIGAAYKNIVMGDEFLARFTTNDKEFTALESYHFNAFVMAVVAACRRAENSEGPWADKDSIYEIASLVDPRDALVPEQESSIHSPGYMTLRGARIVPAVVSALFALAVAAHADPQLDPFGGEGPAQVEVVNSESSAFDPCDVGIDQNVRDALVIMGYERWRQLCIASKRANEHEGLKSIATVRVRPDGVHP